MKGTILQPTYLPWLGFFDMIDASDVFVVYDHAQFVKKSWHCRNRIKTNNGELMLSVPIKKAPQKTPICDITINEQYTLKKHWKTISHAYCKSRYFEDYKDIFADLYDKEFVLLRDLNIAIIKTICTMLGISKKIQYSSELDLQEDERNLCRTEKIISICKKMEITSLFDSEGARELLDCSIFDKEHINIRFQDIKFPHYFQLYDEFITHLSVIDLIFNEGEKSLDLIRSVRRFK